MQELVQLCKNGIKKVVPHRWVNSGAKPIYVFDKNPYSEYPFKLVFDLSDTNNYNNTEYKLWTIKQNYEEDIIRKFRSQFWRYKLKRKSITSYKFQQVIIW